MPPLTAVDLSVPRGVAVPFPDGTTVAGRGVLAPWAASVAEVAELGRSSSPTAICAKTPRGK